MIFGYNIQCPNNNKSGSICLNGKLVYWAALQVFTSNNNVWQYAKRVLNKVNRSTLYITNKTKLFSFITLNKLNNINNFAQIYHNGYYQYVCYGNNRFYSFWISHNSANAIGKINLISRVGIRFHSNLALQNYYFSTYYDNINNTLYLYDPDGGNTMMNIENKQKEKELQIINDLKKYKLEIIEYNNDLYYVTKIDKHITVGLKKEIVDDMTFDHVKDENPLNYELKNNVLSHGGYYIEIEGDNYE